MSARRALWSARAQLGTVCERSTELTHFVRSLCEAVSVWERVKEWDGGSP